MLFKILQMQELILPHGPKNIFLRAFSLWFAQLSSQEKFDIWFSIESRDLNWLNELPKCQSCLPEQNGQFLSPDPKIWEVPKKVYDADKFHPGAVWEVRTLKASKSGAGNQCTYDKNGKIITSRYGCGTADRAQATRSVFLVVVNWIGDSGHIGHDVTPFNLAYKLDGNTFGGNVSKYVDVRPFVGE